MPTSTFLSGSSVPVALTVTTRLPRRTGAVAYLTGCGLGAPAR